MELFQLSNRCSVSVNEEMLQRLGQLLKKTYRLPKLGYFELNFVTAEAMRKLNKEFRKIDKPTDVLSFAAAPMPLQKGESFIVGELFVCLQIAKRNAKRYGHSYDREVAFLTTHGFLHVMGMDHATPAEGKKMDASAERLLKELNLGRDGARE